MPRGGRADDHGVRHRLMSRWWHTPSDSIRSNRRGEQGLDHGPHRGPSVSSTAVDVVPRPWRSGLLHLGVGAGDGAVLRLRDEGGAAAGELMQPRGRRTDLPDAKWMRRRPHVSVPPRSEAEPEELVG